jgi:hypothetical protein
MMTAVVDGDNVGGRLQRAPWAATSSSAAPPRARSPLRRRGQRLVSLDVFRGITVLVRAHYTSVCCCAFPFHPSIDQPRHQIIHHGSWR